MTDDKLAVSQEAREAAAPFAWAGGVVGTMQLRYDIRHGKRDDHPVVQAFARFEAQARLAGERQWQDITSAPKDGTEIIGFRPDQGVFAFRWADADEMSVLFPGEDVPDFAWWWHDRWDWMEGELTPTHWQPLPEPPAILKEAASITPKGDV